MRTQTWWLLIGLAGCEGTVTRLGEGLAPEPSAPDDTADTADTGADADPSWACDNRAGDGTCQQFTGAAWDRVTADSYCDGDLIVDRCPTAAIGACRRDVDFPLEFVDFYYVGPFYDASDGSALRIDCELNQGIWL